MIIRDILLIILSWLLGVKWVDTKADIIEELEKIKAEIDRLYSDCLYGEQLVSKPETMQIIDNHIKELKGENNNA